MAEKKETTTPVQIKPLNFKTVHFTIRGDAPYVQHKFSAKAKQQIIDTQMAGSTAKGKKVREPKDFDALYKGAMHLAADGWNGIPAASFRNAMISACRTVGFKMTHAKLAVFVDADGFDSAEGTPLVKITKGKPRKHMGHGRNDNGGVDIRCRPMWDPGWEAVVRVKYDADMFTLADICNLMVRIGAQVGVGEGRPDSRDSAGLGWGTFEVVKIGANG